MALNNGWRWKKVSSVYVSNLAEVAAGFDDSSWATVNPQSASGPMGEQEHAVFRTKFQVSEQDLAAEAVELCFGSIDEDGWVYINGQPVGESHDWQGQCLDWKGPAIFDIKSALHPGENTLAVAVETRRRSTHCREGRGNGWETAQRPRW